MRPLLLALAPLVFLAACGSNGAPDSGLYIALGDSLSEGVGASDFSATAFVPLVREGLGDAFELVNLGHSGDTSEELLGHGHLDEALMLIEELNGDGDAANDVRLVTLEIGGNDLLDVYFSLVLTGRCPALRQSLARPMCVETLRETLDRFRSNLAETLDRLRQPDPDLQIVVATLYNPFSGRLPAIDELAEFALEGRQDTPFPDGLNDIIREVAGERDMTLVDWHAPFQGKANEYIFVDFIHPNDTGYRVMADAVLESVR